MKLPSPSKLDLALACAFPFNGGLRWPGFDVGSNSTATQHGKAVHLVAERHGKGEAYDVEAIAAEHDLRGKEADTFRATAAGLVKRIDEARAGGIDEEHFELRVAYDVVRDSARVIGERERAYQSEQVGLIDWLYRSGSTWVVVDYKTGRAARAQRASETQQVRWYGVAVRALKGADEVACQLWHANDEGVWVDGGHFFAWDLDIIHEEQFGLVERVKRPSLPVFGIHCREMYCPVVSQCPAAQRAQLALDHASELRYPLSTEFQSVEHAAYVWEVADFIIAAGKHLKNVAANRIKQHGRPVELEHYKARLGIVVHEGNESIECNSDTAQILQRHLGADAKDAIDLSTSKKAIETVASRIAPRGKKKALATAIFDDLRAAGTLKRRAEWSEVGLIEICDDEDNSNEAA